MMLWNATLGVGSLWALLHCLLGWWELRVYWPRRPRQAGIIEAETSRALFRLSLVFPWIWAVVGPFSLSPFRYRNVKPSELLVFLSMAFVLEAGVACFRAVAQRRAALDTNRANLRAALWQESRFARVSLGVLGVMILVWPASGLIPFWCWPFLSAISHWSKDWRLRRLRKLRLEECPLKDELNKLGSRFGFHANEVYVYKTPSELGTPLFARQKGEIRDIQTQIIALRNFVSLNPSTLLAALCCLWASSVRSDSAAAEMNGQSKTTQGVFGCFQMLIVGFALFIILGLTLQFSNRPRVAIGLFGLGVLVIVGVVLAIARDSGSLRMRGEALQDAFEVWSQGDPYEKRTIWDFTRAYAEYSAFFHAIRDPRLLEHRLRLDWAFLALLKRHGLTEQLGEICSSIPPAEQVR